MIPIDSSAIHSVDYDPRSRVLKVRFTSLALYEYFDVPDMVFRQLMAADSKGTYFAQNIRDKYEYRRLT